MADIKAYEVVTLAVIEVTAIMDMRHQLVRSDDYEPQRVEGIGFPHEDVVVLTDIGVHAPSFETPRGLTARLTEEVAPATVCLRAGTGFVASWAPHDSRGALHGIQTWLESLFQPTDRDKTDLELGIAVEVFVDVWKRFSEIAPLAPDDRRQGDAFADMAMEVAKVDRPERRVLRSVFSWFGEKANTFANEFAKSAGRTAGGAAGLAAAGGTGAAVAGILPDLVRAIEAVSHAL